jgi:hypothetical protein
MRLFWVVLLLLALTTDGAKQKRRSKPPTDEHVRPRLPPRYTRIHRCASSMRGL